MDERYDEQEGYAPRDWFRSCEMEYLSIGMQEYCAHKVASELGRLGEFQFTDLNPQLTPFQRRYVREIQRCDELERKLRYFDEMLKKYNITPKPPPEVDTFLDELDRKVGEGQSPTVLLDQHEGLLQQKEKELLSLSGFGASLTNDFNAKVELNYVLDVARNLSSFSPDEAAAGATAAAGALGGIEAGEIGIANQDRSMKFRFVAGVVLKDDAIAFERMIFRATRGNCFLRFTEMDTATGEKIIDAVSGKEVSKVVFIIYYQPLYVEEKIKRVCDAFSATIYQIPDIDRPNEIQEMKQVTEAEIGERLKIIRKNRADTTQLLKDIARMLELWKWTIRREKSIYHALNMCTADIPGVLRGEGWVVANSKAKVTEVVSKVHASMMGDSSRTLPHWTKPVAPAEWPTSPPTYFRVNKFTEVYQLIIDTYGIPRYQEANPALFAAVSFPFMFGVMFGDIGHGLLLFLFSIVLVLKEKELATMELNELAALLYGGRYMLLLNGFFAMYAGFIYNDCFGVGLELFPVMWEPILPPVQTSETTTVLYYQKHDPNAIYPWGVDPTWHVSENSLLFFNSFKMKMAVIIGVIQMSIGIILKGLNAIHWHKGGFNLDLWFEAVPMFFFMQSLFGYMCFMIFYKWGLSWEPDCGRNLNDCGDPNCSCGDPPSLITTLINMALAPGTVDHPLYPGQAQVQVALVLIAVIMVPIMLIPKPYILIQRLKKEHGHSHEADSHAAHHEDDNAALLNGAAGAGSSTEVAVEHGAGKKDEEEHGVGDIVIHQAIETIEFVLGCISNTASYLRLWALSLAHSQLSLVFLERTIIGQLETSGAAGPIMTFGACAVFMCVTFAVILCMDNLECFLHALRLVWVEFMNKFYKGEGLKFAPLNFAIVLKSDGKGA